MTVGELSFLSMIAAGLTSGGVILVTILTIFRPHAQRFVLAALKAQPGEFKRWNDEIYKAELLRSASTERMAGATQSAVQQLRTDFSAHREIIEPHFGLLAQIPQTMHRLTEALRDLARTVERIDTAHRETEKEVVALKARRRNA